MTPLKPYLIRAIYEWIVDNNLTPYLLVNAEYPGAIVPQKSVEDGKIVLNIRPQAIQSLALGNTDIQFDARFSGKPLHIYVPVAAVLALYAKENGKGMIFDQDNENETPPPEKKTPARPVLRVVK